MSEINHEIKIEAPIKKVYKALSTLEGLRGWHTASINGDPKANGIITLKAEGKPLFRWRVLESIPERKVTWQCIEGPGDSVGTAAIYELSKLDESQTLLEFKHTEWPDEEGNFRKCNTLWGLLLTHLKNYLETGKLEPAFN